LNIDALKTAQDCIIAAQHKSIWGGTARALTKPYPDIPTLIFRNRGLNLPIGHMIARPLILEIQFLRINVYLQCPISYRIWWRGI